jgi:DNA polymerase-3 subunit epsilon
VIADRSQSLDSTLFCSLDLETTGVNPLLHRIVEVGIVRFAGCEVLDTYQTLVNPGTPIPEDVTAIHGITDDMVAAAPPISAVIGRIRDFIGNACLVIHNPAFDLAFLARCFRDDGQGDFSRGLAAFDTVRLARKAYPHLHSHRLAVLAGHFNLQAVNHRALSDARCCMDVFHRVISQAGPKQMATLGSLMDYHGGMVRPRQVKEKTRTSGSFAGLTVGRKARIRYRDNNGVISERDIIPLEILSRGRKNYFLAHCLLRHRDRFFRVEGILEVL